MTTPTVSVVMSVFNGERYLAEAVESILGQNFHDFEFIVINDGSTDRTSVILESYLKIDPRLRVHHQEHKGLVESLNFGCALARGKYVARTDADDIAIEDRLMRQVDFMEKHPDIGVLGGAVQVIDSTGKALETSVNPAEDKDIKLALLRGHCPFWHPSVLMRTDVFVSTGGYRKIVSGAEDHDLWLRIADHYRLANLETVVLKYAGCRGGKKKWTNRPTRFSRRTHTGAASSDWSNQDRTIHGISRQISAKYRHDVRCWSILRGF
jgi:glycosyltransferase involved in cell wall biosynthesis